MSPAHVRKVAGTEPSHTEAAHTTAGPPTAGATATTPVPLAVTVPAASPAPTDGPDTPDAPGSSGSSGRPGSTDTGPEVLPARGTPDHHLAVQDRLASWVCDLSLLHELTERLARTDDLDAALHEVLRAGATLVGARRGLIALEPADGLGPDSTVGLGLGHGELGTLETVPDDPPRTIPADRATATATAPERATEAER